MFTIYTLVPSSSPRLRPAAIGAAVSAVLLLIGLNFFGTYVNNLNSIGQLYGSLGLIPLFMFCVYLLWLGVLFGLEVSVILQTLPGHRLEELEQKRQTGELVDPVSVLSLMAVIGERFTQAQPTTLFRACELTGLSESVVTRMFAGLVEGSLLHRLDGPNEMVSLAKPPDQIATADLLEVAYRLTDRGDSSCQSPLLSGLRLVQQNCVAESTLTELITERQATTV
jgi:membrane protein